MVFIIGMIMGTILGLIIATAIFMIGGGKDE